MEPPDERKNVLYVTFGIRVGTAFPIFSGLLKDRYNLAYLHIPDINVRKSEYSLLDIDYEEIINFCENYDYVLFSVTYFYAKLVFRILEHLKSHAPRVITIAGGPQVMLDPHSFLKYADYVCLFDGEGIRELLKYLDTHDELRSIGNFVCREEDVPRPWEWVGNLDTLPMMDYLSGNHFFYTRKGIRELEFSPPVSFETIRGCPFHCNFCFNALLNPLKMENNVPLIRRRSMKNILQQLEDIVQGLPDLKHISFSPTDNFFLHSKEELIEFASEFDERIGVPLMVVADLRSEGFFEKVEILARVRNLSEIHFGIQTGSERLNREVYARQMGPADILERFVFLKNTLPKDVTIWLDFIYGHPEEGRDDIVETINLMLALRGAKFWLNQYIAVPRMVSSLQECGEARLSYSHIDMRQFSRFPFYYFFMFVLKFCSRSNLLFIFPKRFTPNWLTDFLNHAFFGRIYLAIIKLSIWLGEWRWKRANSRLISPKSKDSITYEVQ